MVGVIQLGHCGCVLWVVYEVRWTGSRRVISGILLIKLRFQVAAFFFGRGGGRGRE